MAIGRRGPPTLAHLAWWTTRGEHQTTKRPLEQHILVQIDQLWGKEVLHIWDRGFAGQPWLTCAFFYVACFVMRWNKDFKLIDAQGRERKPGAISKGQRSWEHRQLWDARRRCLRKVGIIAFPVQDTVHHQPLWLLAARYKNQPPWYLLTNEPIRQPADAWRIVQAYARRWHLEMAIRYSETELAFESPRLVGWQQRKKLLFMAGLCHAFLLSLLHFDSEQLRGWLLHTL